MIPAKNLSWDMIDLVKRTSEQHALELRFIDFTPQGSTPKTSDPAGIVITLENIVSKVHTEKQRRVESDPKRAITAMLSEAGLSELSASDVQDIKAMLAQQRRGGPSQPKKRCDKCGAFHMGTCFAQMIADGKYPDAFKKLDRD